MNGLNYLIDKSLSPNCYAGYSKSVTFKKNEQVDFAMTDLCMLSVYNISVSTYLDGFNTKNTNKVFKTGN